MTIPHNPQPPSLVVFSDDWGRHPSSCQHLVRELLPRHAVLWVNTIGTRTPRFDRETFHRVGEKLRQWRRRETHEPGAMPATRPASAQEECRAPRVVNPRMWPWFTHRIDRRINRALLETQLRPAIERLPKPVVAMTTLPITADLVGRLPVDAWLYYCVDDFREWPGLDGRTLGLMEEDLVERVDEVIVVSETLRQRMSDLGRSSQLLTHGCDLEFWCASKGGHVLPGHTAAHPHLQGMESPIVLFFGVIDRRMDVSFVRRLGESMAHGTILLVGPAQNPDPELARCPRVVLRPAVPFAELPSLAAAASVLVMPYADLPVTRAMQPLKLKEYLATGKPAVVRSLPAVADWTDALDAANTPEAFAQRVRERITTGLPESQRRARHRLSAESWNAKASALHSCLRQLVASSPRRIDVSSPHAEGVLA